MKTDKEHIHKLTKHKYPTGVDVFFCTLDCNFKVEVPFALGKIVLCNICSEPFVMTKRHLNAKEPHCGNCGRKAIKDADGKKRFIRKASGRVLTSIAVDSANSLASRLKAITGSNDEGDI